MTLMGLSELGDTRTDLQGLWERFDALESRIYQAVPLARYIIFTWGAETELFYKHFMFVGVEITGVQTPPLNVVVKILPPVQYAVFSAWSRELDSVWNYAFEEWLPQSPYEEPGFIIQRYDRQRYMQAQPGRREIDIYLPLRPKKKAGV